MHTDQSVAAPDEALEGGLLIGIEHCEEYHSEPCRRRARVVAFCVSAVDVLHLNKASLQIDHDARTFGREDELRVGERGSFLINDARVVRHAPRLQRLPVHICR